jgi:putative transposase
VLDEIVREAARQMLAVALQAEVSACIDALAEKVDENGHGWWSATVITTNAR